jgi:ATP-dependent Lhr-like helicase
VFRDLVARETSLPPWRELIVALRRLEARGEIRGGRFVAGMSGEQFALPRAVERLREVRRTPPSGQQMAISAADPLNLAGIITAGERVRAAGRTHLVYQDGVPVAVTDHHGSRIQVDGRARLDGHRVCTDRAEEALSR